MSRYRSILAGILALITVFVVSCGGPQASEPPLYSQIQLERIQEYKADIQSFRDRMSELESLIQERDWIDVGNFIHGPLGDLRRDMGFVARNLDPQDAKAARNKAKELFVHLETIDRAATEANYSLALNNYAEALADFDAFLNQLPNS
jgi:photosystem II protein PsbQ